MERLKRPEAGFTLIELLIATVLFSVVLLAGSGLLINFGKFSSNLIKSEASLMGTALGAFEQVVGRIEESNQVTIPALNFAAVPSIDIRVSPSGAATSDHSTDTYHTFWMTGNQLYYKKSAAGGAPPAAAVSPATDTAIAKDIQSLSFSYANSTSNQVRVTLDAQTAGNMGREHLDTIAVARSRRA